MTTYVYENVEVKLTGRTATRKTPSGKLDALHEITPADSITGQWKRWVRMLDLYEIQGAGLEGAHDA